MSRSQSERPKPRRRWLQYSLRSLLLLMLLTAVWVRFGPLNAPVDPIKSDLALKVTLREGKKLPSNSPINLEVNLVNKSRSRSHYVVKPSDGSEAGWREPYVYYTAKYLAPDGKWKDVKKRPWDRCGHYDDDWFKDIVQLPPGKSVRLDCVIDPRHLLDIPTSSRVRLFVHYAYRAETLVEASLEPGMDLAAVLKARPELKPRLQAMREVPSFEIVSKPIEFTLGL